MMGMGGVRTGPAESWVTLNLLAKDLDAGLALLIDCLKTPAFQDDRLQLAKERAIQRMKERNDDTAGIERREWSLLIDGPDHWSNRWTTEASVGGIVRDDLTALHRALRRAAELHPRRQRQLRAGAMKKALEKAFADWPWQAQNPGVPAAPAAAPPAGWFAVDKEVNQARVSFGLPALDRYDPDWYAALVMNDILGARRLQLAPGQPHPLGRGPGLLGAFVPGRRRLLPRGVAGGLPDQGATRRRSR